MHILKSYLKELLISIFGIIIIFLLWNLSQNGRYQTMDNTRILDTRSGKIYEMDFRQKNPNDLYYWKLHVHNVGPTFSAKK